MTTMTSVEINCPICKSKVEINMLMSTNMWGAPDLDLRPPEMRRSTMDTWVHECPQCGYVASDFKKTPEITEDFLKSDSYRSCDFHEFKHPLSERFYRQYLIAPEDEEKFYALLHCAWACDDRDDRENAVLIRAKSLEYMDCLDLNDDMMIQRADLLRRSNQFERVIDEYSAKSFDEDIYNQICSFEVEKAMQKDNACYTVEDTVND